MCEVRQCLHLRGCGYGWIEKEGRPLFCPFFTINLLNDSAESVIWRKCEETTKSDKKRKRSEKTSKRSDKKRHKATFSQKVLTLPLLRLKFSLQTTTNKGVANVRREGGSFLINFMIIQVVQSLSF